MANERNKGKKLLKFWEDLEALVKDFEKEESVKIVLDVYKKDGDHPHSRHCLGFTDEEKDIFSKNYPTLK